MTIEKLDAATPDLTRQNIERLLELFPECRTEGSREDAPSVDFDLLRQAVSGFLVEGPAERYRLDWPGKREALLTANTPIDKTLRPMREESVDFDSTRNLFIEGDNLDALKLLQETYLGKVKMIYIDPPYNTGSDFIYNDNFRARREEYEIESEQRDGTGGRLVANPDSNGRFHSDWLSMMLPRIKLARNLLSDDGVLFVSLDQNEDASFRKLADEIFGESNYVYSLAVKVNPRGRHLDRYIASTHENLIIYAKNAQSGNALRGMSRSDEMIDEFDREDEAGPYRLLGLRNRNQAFNPETRPNLYFPLFVRPSDGAIFLEQDAGLEGPVLPLASDGTPTCWTWSREKISRESDALLAEKVRGEWRVFRKSYLHGEDGEASRTLPKSMWDGPEFNNDRGRSAVKELFGKAVMDFPKPPDLIKLLIEIGTYQDSIILDFFSGSGTTAHAMLQYNAEHGTSHRFLMVQLDEQIGPDTDAGRQGFTSLACLARERIRRAGARVIKEGVGLKDKLDTGFRAFRIDSGSLRDTRVIPKEATQEALAGMVSHIKDDRSEEDLLLGALLRWGVDITLPIEQRELAGRTVWLVDPTRDGSGTGAALIACFARPQNGRGGIDTELADAMAELVPLRILFRDDGFADDATKENVHSRFQQRTPDTQVRVL
ncbi:MAG: site-specific DNA-methyltransferase [Sphingomicrobium sp.]